MAPRAFLVWCVRIPVGHYLCVAALAVVVKGLLKVKTLSLFFDGIMAFNTLLHRIALLPDVFSIRIRVVAVGADYLIFFNMLLVAE